MKAVVTLIVIAALGACSTLKFPGVHRITIQQGNVITQTMIDKLKPGMTKSQVRFVLGNPLIEDPLSQERWDYVYSVQIRGGDPIRKKLILHFVEGRLSHFEGDYVPTSEKEEVETADAG